MKKCWTIISLCTNGRILGRPKRLLLPHIWSHRKHLVASERINSADGITVTVLSQFRNLSHIHRIGVKCDRWGSPSDQTRTGVPNHIWTEHGFKVYSTAKDSRKLYLAISICPIDRVYGMEMGTHYLHAIQTRYSGPPIFVIGETPSDHTHTLNFHYLG